MGGGKDEDIKAADSWVWSWKLVALKGGGHEGELVETENSKAVVCFKVNNAVGNVGNAIGQRKMFGSIEDIK